LAELLLFLFCHSTFQILVCIQHCQFFSLWKESLKNDGHQFHQYQQNNELTEHEKNTTTYDVGNPGPGLRQAQKCDGVNKITGIPIYLKKIADCCCIM